MNMKQFLLLILLSFIVFLSVSGQDKRKVEELNSFYEEGYRRSRIGENIDSALFYIKKLALNQEGFSYVQTLMHSGIAGNFFGLETIPKGELERYYLILNKIVSGSDKNLANAAKPLFLCVLAQHNKDDDEILTNLTNEFIKTQLTITKSDFYKNRISMYAFLIYDIISKKEKLKRTSTLLLQAVVNKLKKNLNNINVDTANSLALIEQTIWYRWMYACANFFQAKKALEEKKIKEAGAYYKTASDGIGLWEKRYSVFYFRDMIFIFKKEQYFTDDYFIYLKEYSTNKDDALNALLVETLRNPSKKEALKKYYTTNFPDKDAFDIYWLKSVNNIAHKAPNIHLKTITGSQFSLAEQMGRWLLLDFWGTWCGPCRQEHPDLQKFYQNITTSYPDKISLLTIACRDNEKSVSNYMEQFKYSFPVVMADNAIQKNYHVGSWPSKFLITPQGKYIPISLDVNWVDFVKGYVGL